MKPVFADMFYCVALLLAKDAAHHKAVAVTTRLKSPVVTTAWVLAELANTMASPPNRHIFMSFFEALRQSPDVTIVPASRSLFVKDMALYGARQDKSWSLTDCISFVVMQQHRIREALTGDVHFQQAGFRMLLA